jgi:hypothetical protein
MSKTSELDLTLQELRSAVQSMLSAADGLAAFFGNSAESKVAPEPKAEPTAPKPVTLEQVRAVLADKSRAGHTTAVRALLEQHGANKLSEIDPTEYAALLKEAEGIGNG